MHIFFNKVNNEDILYIIIIQKSFFLYCCPIKRFFFFEYSNEPLGFFQLSLCLSSLFHNKVI